MDTSDAYAMARDLMDLYGLGDWTFEWSRAVSQFGRCTYSTKTIRLSRTMTLDNDVADVRDTVLHEIAHALAGPGAGHGAVWQDQCLKVGARPERCYDSSRVIQQPAPWIGVCPNCGKKLERFRRRKIACGKCCNRFNRGKFSDEYRFVWHKRESEG